MHYFVYFFFPPNVFPLQFQCSLWLMVNETFYSVKLIISEGITLEGSNYFSQLQFHQCWLTHAEPSKAGLFTARLALLNQLECILRSDPIFIDSTRSNPIINRPERITMGRSGLDLGRAHWSLLHISIGGGEKMLEILIG